MSQTLNVLSIDFDYFQKVSKDVLMNCYPDGLDLSTELSIFTWSGYYNNPNSAKELQTSDTVWKVKICSYFCEEVCINESNSHNRE